LRKILIILLLFPVFSGYSQNFDINLLRDINQNRNKNFDGFFRGVTNSASPVAFGTPVILYGVGLLKKDANLKKSALYIGASVVTSSFITTIMKYSVKRTRPFITYPDIEKVTSGGSYSFPSGHTSDAFSLATSVTIAYPKWYINVPAYGWASAVAYSRMDLGVHYPSDVLAGAVIGAGSAYLCYKAQHWINKKRKK
jgi:membrane-associated phospholipid phosphatase